MILKTVFAASMNDNRRVLTGVLLNIEGKLVSIVATDGFRYAIYKAKIPVALGKKQLIISASTFKEVVHILGPTKASQITIYLPSNGSQVAMRCENV